MKMTMVRRILINGCTIALAGTMASLLLAACANAISGSTLGIVVTMIVVTALGGWAGRFAGAICGALCGILLVSFASTIGNSIQGVAIAAGVCAFVAAWFNWLGASNEHPNPGTSDEDPSSDAMFQPLVPTACMLRPDLVTYDDGARGRGFHKEYTQWT
jgi:hypothetical protein